MRRYIAFLFIMGFSSVCLSAETEKVLSGDVRLLSHYVEHGLSQSDKSPAIQGNFWFNLGPQFRLGASGSSVNFAETDEHFNLLLKADLRIDISAQSSLKLNYAKSQYYDSDHRNGSIFGIHLKYHDYRILYDSFSNWEGTNKESTRFGAGTEMKVFTNWTWDLEGGYNSPSVENQGSYFDAKTGLGRPWGPIFVEGSLTGTSASSDFEHGEGDFFFILSLKTEL